MAVISISVNQQLDKCGDEFLDERDFTMDFDVTSNAEYVIATIDGRPDCYIKKSDLLVLLQAIESAARNRLRLRATGSEM